MFRDIQGKNRFCHYLCFFKQNEQAEVEWISQTLANLRPGSYVGFLSCRIIFDRNSTFESAAAFPPHVRLVLSNYPTEMRHRFKRRISAVSNLMHHYVWACINLVSPKKKKKLAHSRPNATWRLQHILLHCQPSPSRPISQNESLSSLSIFVRHIEYSTFETFSWGQHTRQYLFWIKCDASATSKSTVVFLLHLIELN